MNERLAPTAAVLPVSLLVSSARLLIERQLGLAWISGEVSNCTRAASGHLYFLLKDARAQVRCVLFRSKAQLSGIDLRDGMQVEVRATPTIYEARGEFQLNVETVRLAGLGALYERFARLKTALEARGWFDPERKRPLPAFPRRIGIVTSPRAAALHDVLVTLRCRFPCVRVVLYPASVQGPGAAAELARAVRVANARAEVDLLIVCRGGGSIEDLWAFNEEILAHAIHESRLVVVSAVGHETDFTICDFVADARAATPTAAAALAAPDCATLGAQLQAIARRLHRGAVRSVEARMQRLDGLAPRVVHPAARLAARDAQLRGLAQRLVRAAANRNERHALRIEASRKAWCRHARRDAPQRAAVTALAIRCVRAAQSSLERIARRSHALDANLRHLDPRRVLERGYAIVIDDASAVVMDAGQLAPGDALSIAFARGEASVVVRDTKTPR